MKTYISLPISGRPIDEARAEAERMKDLMQRLYVPEIHHEVITPFDIVPDPPDMPPHEQYAYCMGRDIEVLLTCSHIAMCPGWRMSKGCQAEHAIAEVYGLAISYISSMNLNKQPL
ncbi:MAG: DUF4406 domain-containing protein [Bacteroidaceae bacterium]|nr:DUF4406 domain-containing protein [Bacteroidaceae bacterium]